MVAVPECFPPERRAIGFLVEKELQILDRLLGHPKTPMVAIMGGAKVSDKIGVIENLLPKIDRLLIGGAMTYTFLKAQGHADGQEPRRGRQARRGPPPARAGRAQAGPPARSPGRPRARRRPPRRGSSVGWDLPEDCVRPRHRAGDRHRLWRDHPGRRHGDLERPDGQVRGRALPQGDPGASPRPWPASSAVTVVGGGETAEAVEQFGFADAMTHVSTGGGAFLESLEGKAFNSLRVIPDQPG